MAMDPGGQRRLEAEAAPHGGIDGDLGARPWRLVEAGAVEADASHNGGPSGWLGGDLAWLHLAETTWKWPGSPRRSCGRGGRRSQAAAAEAMMEAARGQDPG